jgi:benzoate membrane transport protein
VIIAWSTPGAALLATSLQGLSLSVAVGAFLVCALLITVSGVTGLFERLMNKVPLSLASALLGGVLLHFGLQLFTGLATDAPLVLPMIVAYLLCRRWLPRYAVLVALATGVAAAAVTDQLHTARLHLALAEPVFVRPEFTWQAVVGVAVPLFVVTMSSQNIPGTAAIRAAGYTVPISRIITVTGATTLVLAPFGAFALNLAAITAAICLGEEAHPDAGRRYVAGVSAGVLYIVIGVFGATVAALLVAFPATLVLAIAGLGLLGTIGGAMQTMIADAERREASLITFLFAASGITLLGIGAPFWALVAGTATLLLLRRGRPATGRPADQPPAPSLPAPSLPAPSLPAPSLPAPSQPAPSQPAQPGASPREQTGRADIPR